MKRREQKWFIDLNQDLSIHSFTRLDHFWLVLHGHEMQTTEINPVSEWNLVNLLDVYLQYEKTSEAVSRYQFILSRLPNVNVVPTSDLGKATYIAHRTADDSSLMKCTNLQIFTSVKKSKDVHMSVIQSAT